VTCKEGGIHRKIQSRDPIKGQRQKGTPVGKSKCFAARVIRVSSIKRKKSVRIKERRKGKGVKNTFTEQTSPPLLGRICYARLGRKKGRDKGDDSKAGTIQGGNPQEGARGERLPWPFGSGERTI